MNISATNKNQLLRLLRATDISVPSRGPERTNDHVERWLIARLLATLCESDRLSYPLKTIKSERPDYLVFQENLYMGFEITEAVNPLYVKAQFLPVAKNKNSIIDPGHFKWGMHYDRKQLRDIASRKQLTATPWMGNDVEKEYAQIVNDITLKKTKILLKPAFQKYAEDNLVIYMNQMLPMLNSTEATSLCSNVLNDYWGRTTFDNIYVEFSNEFHHYSADGVQVLALNDLWR